MTKITIEEMESAVEFLAMTDDEYARCKSYYDGLMEQRKIIKARAFMSSRAGPQSQKEQEAYASVTYTTHIEKIERANYDYLKLQAERSTASIKIDCWRSLNAARNKGQFF